jgi:hypothetical protein
LIYDVYRALLVVLQRYGRPEKASLGEHQHKTAVLPLLIVPGLTSRCFPREAFSMGTREDLTGRTFGRLTAKEFAEKRKSGPYWRCECECGNSVVVWAANLKRGSTRSCGCLNLEVATEHMRKLGASSRRHGESHTYLHKTWDSMHQRCNNPNDKSYHRYGGRGITVHPSFAVYEDFRDYVLNNLGHRKPGESLDRENNNGNYEPGNLRWATRHQQGRNQDTNRIVEVFGEAMCMAEAVEKYGAAPYETTLKRLNNYGWPLEKALLTPPRKQKNNARPTPTPNPEMT